MKAFALSMLSASLFASACSHTSPGGRIAGAGAVSTDSWVDDEGLAATASANPTSFMVAGARNTECYTPPITYWIDLRR